jgi:hypothetical protein
VWDGEDLNNYPAKFLLTINDADMLLGFDNGAPPSIPTRLAPVTPFYGSVFPEEQPGGDFEYVKHSLYDCIPEFEKQIGFPGQRYGGYYSAETHTPAALFNQVGDALFTSAVGPSRGEGWDEEEGLSLLIKPARKIAYRTPDRIYGDWRPALAGDFSGCFEYQPSIAMNAKGQIVAEKLVPLEGGSPGQTRDAAILYAPVEFVSVDENGDLTDEASDLSPSAPSPIVEAITPDISDVRIGNGRVFATIRVQGTIKSPFCDTIPGADGQIDLFQIFINDGDEPAGTGTVTVTKATGPKIGKPYPYAGTFDGTFPMVEVVPGRNVLRISAMDKVYQIPGYEEWRFQIDPVYPTAPGVPPSVHSAVLGAALPALPPAPGVARTIALSYRLANGTDLPLVATETAVESGQLHASASGVEIVIDGVFARPASQRRNGVARITDPGRGFVAREMSLVETATGTGVFTGALHYQGTAQGVVLPPPPAEGDDDPEPIGYIAGETSQLHQSDGGEFHPFVVMMRAPGYLAQFYSIQFGSTDLNAPGSLKTDFISHLNVPEEHQVPNGCFAKHPEQNKPLVLTARPASPFGDQSNEKKARALANMELSWEQTPVLQFGAGFALGVFNGGVEMVIDNARSLKGAADYLLNSSFAVGIKIWVGLKESWNLNASQERMLGAEFQKETARVHREIVQILKALWELGVKTNQIRSEVIRGFVNGVTYGSLEVEIGLFSQRHREEYMWAAQLLSDLGDRIAQETSNPRKAGYLFGRVTVEIVSMMSPGAGVAKLGKLKFLKKFHATSEALNMRELRSVRTKVGKDIPKLEKSRMCFLAGTAIWTAEGLRPIEKIRTGDWVLARDEYGTEQMYKPVVATMVTHPAALVHIRYSAQSRHSGEEGEGESLVCTAEHPFHVSNRADPGFVEAGQLQMGDQLRLADGGAAVVRGIEVQRATGAPFTTYNFEVADFHTYFAGASGVWVHNYSARHCDDWDTRFKTETNGVELDDPALKGQRLPALKAAFAKADPKPTAINGPECNQAMHAVGRAELRDFSGNPNNLADLPTYAELKSLRDAHNLGAAGYQIHHIVPRWVCDRLNRGQRAVQDTSPALTMPNTRLSKAELDEYMKKFNEKPVYHSSAGEPRSLEAALQGSDMRKPPVGAPAGPVSDMLADLRKVYTSPEFVHLNLWPAARAWLVKQSHLPEWDIDIVMPAP